MMRGVSTLLLIFTLVFTTAHAVHAGGFDTKGLGTMAKPVVGVLAAAVQVERELSMERSREGIQAARNKGVPFGPKRKYTNEQAEHVRDLRAQGKSYGAISKATGLSVSTVRRILGVV